ncbi:transcription antitermination factor NusB [Xanthomonadaceae bacterium XH05]|nr:transcription antitermination factor NusB [Xanthomonadaceae bacterium XH05]
MTGHHSRRMRPDGIDPAARSRARRRALQALYAWQLSGQDIAQVIAQFRSEQDMEIADLEYFEDLLRGVNGNLAKIDEELRRFVDRDIAQIDPIERGVLRLAAYELLFRIDVPYRVVLNEAIETTKRFGADHGHSYVNGVLDRAAAEWRGAEATPGRG